LVNNKLYYVAVKKEYMLFAKDQAVKKIFKLLYEKIKKLFLWIWQECNDKHTFALLLLVCIIIGSPVWISYLLWFVFKLNWALWIGSAMLAFWWLPGAPYFALCIAVTLGIKRVFQKIKKNREMSLKKTTEDSKKISKRATARDIDITKNN